MLKDYVVICKRQGQEDPYPHELTDAQLYQWLKNGSIQDGDIVYEVVNKRIARQPDMTLEPA